MSVVNIGIVGLGTVGGGVVRLLQRHREDYLSSYGVDLRIAKACARTEARGEELGLEPDVFTTDWREVVADPEVDIVVELIGGDHPATEIFEAAFEAGKHVVVDKPFTVTLSQARELESLAKHCGRVLSVFHNRRWDSDFLTVRTLIDEGLLGEVCYFESHFDRFRPQVRQRWREQAGPGSGIWYDLGPHLLDQAVVLFGLPVSITVDLAQLRPGAQSTDYFHAVLAYPQRRVVLHGTLLAAAESARFIVHGSRASFIKYGLDPQEERLKNGERLPQEDWGYDMRDGTLTRAEGDERSEETWLTLPGNYPAYYAAIRDALNGVGENPVPASEAIQIMSLLELGIESARHRATLSLV